MAIQNNIVREYGKSLSPGHCCRLQGSVTNVDPLQLTLPLHVLTLVWVPPPHVFVHVPITNQGLQPTETNVESKKVIKRFRASRFRYQ